MKNKIDTFLSKVAIAKKGGGEKRIKVQHSKGKLTARERIKVLLDDNSLIDLKQNEIPPNRKLLDPITNETLQKFDNYKINEIEKFVCRFKNHINNEINLNDKIKIIQILGENFSNKKYKPLIDHNTGFNLSILKSKQGSIENLIFDKPTILFSQIGNWKIKIEKDEFNVNSKDTLSIPTNTKVSISIDNNKDCFLNCVSKA